MTSPSTDGGAAGSTRPAAARTAASAGGTSTGAAGGAAAKSTTGVGTAVPGAPGQRRRARLIVSRVDPITVAKVSLVLATGLAIAFIVAITLLWVLFQTAGVFDTVSRTINDVAGSQIDARSLVSFPRIIGIALLLSVVQVVLTTALATLVSMLYNLAAYFVGGVSVTLTEDS